jgi:hypothetical protein
MTNPDLPSIERLQEVCTSIRQASRSGIIVPTDDKDSILLECMSTTPGCEDIRVIEREGTDYLYSDRHMTRPYAELAARAWSNELLRVIAETVRSDSATYPRPTPATLFSAPPFRFSPQQISAALGVLAGGGAYADIGSVAASDGSQFLFSSTHMDRAQAQSLAEWFAVGHLQNP